MAYVPMNGRKKAPRTADVGAVGGVRGVALRFELNATDAQ